MVFPCARRAASDTVPDMGRLDDIVARNQPRRGAGGLIGAVINETHDPLDTPADRSRKQLAWVIVGAIVLAVVVLVAIFA